MSRKVIDPFDNEDNYNFGSEIEVDVGESKLVAQVVGAEAALYAKLDENNGLVALDSSGNNRHGAFQGGYDENQWTPGKINSAIQGINITSGFINFDQLISFERTEAFSLECWIKFTTTSTQSLISKQKDSGAFEGFGMNMAAGKLRLVIRDANNNVNTVETVNTYNDDIWHHVVVTYDGNNIIGGLNVYVDNVLDRSVSSSAILSDTIINDADLQISGRDGNNICIDSTTSIDEVLIYDRELTTAEISFRWNGGAGTQTIPGASTAFPTNNPTLTSKSNFLATQIQAFDAVIVAAGSDEIRFVILINNVDMYWNGSIWAISTTFAESNTLAEIQANITTLDLGSGQPVNYKPYYHSNDGSSTPVLSEVEIDFDFFGSDVDNPNECIVFGKIFDEDGLPVENVAIKINSTCPVAVYDGESVISFSEKETITNSFGAWSISLIETTRMDIKYDFEFIDGTTTQKFRRGVPDEITKNFSELPD